MVAWMLDFMIAFKIHKSQAPNHKEITNPNDQNHERKNCPVMNLRVGICNVSFLTEASPSAVVGNLFPDS